MQTGIREFLRDVRERMRDLLEQHYMVGDVVEGRKIERWLLEYGGWFPDPQEMYGDGWPALDAARGPRG